MRLQEFYDQTLATPDRRAAAAGEALTPASAPGSDELRGSDEAAARDAQLATALGEAEERARALAAAEHRLVQLCTELEAEAVAASARRAQREREQSAAFEAAVRAALPALSGSGFAAEAAAAILAIARAADRPRMTVRVSPEALSQLSALLDRAATSETFALVPDGSLGEGRVRLDWEQGGAEIDRARLERAALDALGHHVRHMTGDDNVHA
jgi:hypothetical protein